MVRRYSCLCWSSVPCGLVRIPSGIGDRRHRTARRAAGEPTVVTSHQRFFDSIDMIAAQGAPKHTDCRWCCSTSSAAEAPSVGGWKEEPAPQEPARGCRRHAGESVPALCVRPVDGEDASVHTVRAYPRHHLHCRTKSGPLVLAQLEERFVASGYVASQKTRWSTERTRRTGTTRSCRSTSLAYNSAKVGEMANGNTAAFLAAASHTH